MKTNNQLWRFFASVQLALVNFIALASTSVIGTLIPQGRIPAYYIDSYGSIIGQIFLVLDFDKMYESWWFLGLLAILALNLIVCSIDRYPATAKRVKSDGLKFSISKIESMPLISSISTNKKIDLDNFLAENSWTNKRTSKDGDEIYFSQKHAWSHYGVYIVHISILIIFLGAIVGSLAGFKASVMIPELSVADKVYSSGDSTVIPLGFEVRCNQFDLEYYETGAPKTYRSSLTIIEGGNEILTTDIEVNTPLIYKGITFYQASYEGFQDFIITIKDLKTGEKKSLVTVFQEQTIWKEKKLQLGILNATATDQHIEKLKLWYYGDKGDPQTLWFDNGETKELHGLGYEISIKQKYGTGLQVAKDPGVWLVYLGCFLLMLGLYICFFFSHQKLWLIEKADSITLAGQTNKNMTGFQKKFEALAQNLKNQLKS